MSDSIFEPKHLAGIPLFPLPRVVFFPHTTMPLHVFEPRYRALTEFCLESEWPLALPMIQPGQEDDHLGHPDVAPVCGLGRITHSQEMQDGRYGIILQGVVRVRIEEEVDVPQPYRVARVRVVPEVAPSEAEAREQLHTIRECLTVLSRRIPKLSEALLAATGQSTDPAVVTDRLSQLIFRDAAHRQRLLETTDVSERLREVVARLSALAAGTARAEAGVN